MNKKEQLQFINSYKNEKKKSEKECHEIWREIVTRRAKGKCEYYGCQMVGTCNAHHFFSKGAYPHLRHDIDNGIYLCYNHHTGNNKNAAHLDPYFKDKILGRIAGYKAIRTEEWLTKLELKAQSSYKLDLKMELLYLQNKLKEYGDTKHNY